MYSREDFYEAFERVKEYLPAQKLAECVKAFGVIGPDGEWEGGFIVRMADASMFLIAAFCDCEGWDVSAEARGFLIDNDRTGRMAEIIDLHNAAFPERSLPDLGYWDSIVEDINDWIFSGCKPTEIF